jgi:predicted restriction endonuclease
MDLSVADILAMLEERFPVLPQNDSAAEAAESDPVLVEEFQKRIEHQDYSIADATATVKTRGSAQHAFADAVKANYSYRCAVTGIATREFLVASHIVPWAEDASIRLDPANGICLSLIIDRAFEKGYLLVEDDMTLRVDRKRVGSDAHLLAMLEPHDGTALSAPSQEPPNPEYLRRRRVLVSKTLD